MELICWRSKGPLFSICVLLLSLLAWSSSTTAFAPPRLTSTAIIRRQKQPSITTRILIPPLTPRFYRDRHQDEDELTTTDTRHAIQQQRRRRHNEEEEHSAPSRRQRDEGDEDTSSSSSKKNVNNDDATALLDAGGGMNHPMIRNLCLSQVVILTVCTVLALAFGTELTTLTWHPSISSVDGLLNPLHNMIFSFLTSMLQGVVAAIPMIAWGSVIEHSTHRDASHVNFATTNMVVTLFGRRRQRRNNRQHPSSSSSIAPSPSTTTTTTSTAHVCLWSLVLASLTALSEEVIFRVYIPTAIAAMTHSTVAALLGQALFFGLGHVHHKSHAGENRVVVALQTLNGLWHGVVYLVTGGNLGVCILAHVLYDMHVLCQSWHHVNEQIDWTEQNSYPNLVLSNQQEAEIRKIQKESLLKTETLGFLHRFFYAFDYEHKGSLSLADVQRAVSYAFLQDKLAPSQTDVENMFYDMSGTRDRLQLPEFLRLLFALRSKACNRNRKRVAAQP